MADAKNRISCYNAECKLYRKDRSLCPQCRLHSRVHFQGTALCISRDCPSNQARLGQCFFCKNRSLLRLKSGVYFCQKSDCPHLFELLSVCFFCARVSFLLEAKNCQNSFCKVYKLPIETCPSCHQRCAIVLDEKQGVCKNGKCSTDTFYWKPHQDATKQLQSLDRILKPAAVSSSHSTLMDLPKLEVASSGSELEEVLEGEGGKGDSSSDSGDVEEIELEVGEEGEDAEEEDAEEIELEVGEKGEDAEEDAEEIELELGEEREDAEEDVEEIELEVGEEGGESPLGDSGEVEGVVAGSERGEGEEVKSSLSSERSSASGKLGELEVGGVSSRSGSVSSASEGEDPDFFAFTSEAETESISTYLQASPWQKIRGSSKVLPRRPVGGTSQWKRMELPEAESDFSILQAFDFVRNHILNGPQAAPLYLIIGLAGAGKTTYLTMLGDILLCKDTKYHYPYRGVEVRWIEVEKLIEKNLDLDESDVSKRYIGYLKERIQDLVYHFAQNHYQKYIGRMQWSEATAREEEGKSEISTYFLLTELTRYGKVISRIITIETSGEDFQEVIESITQKPPEREGANPLHYVLYELLNLAEGFLILLDPANEENNDKVYQKLFLVLKECLEPRAISTLYREVIKRLDYRKKMAETPDSIRKGFLYKKLSEQEREQKQREVGGIRRKLEEDLSRFQLLISQTQGEVLLGEEAEFLQKLEDEVLEDLFPNILANARKNLYDKLAQTSAEGHLSLYIKYYEGLLNFCVSHIETIAQNFYEKSVDLQARFSEAAFQDMAERIIRERGLDGDFKIDLVASEFWDSPQHYRFAHLKNIAIAITKTDMYPIIYPPEKYAMKKMPRSWMHLRAIENYLKLCGGGVKYYNSSATGYSILRDTLYYPGKENTLTPINIIEPIFDLLCIR
ncbi:MAG: hypothetical protein D6805_04050 [Planctomycetota bacterium]|nr:MAG: hypothetical protein D6805_04050 [Planctomycetota bacterium]